MRELKDIAADIDKLNGERNEINHKLRDLYIERRKRMQFDFEQKHGLKRGDLVELLNGTHYFYDGLNPYSDRLIWVICRKLKKDGSPSLNIRSIPTEAFKNCKIIGHKDL